MVSGPPESNWSINNSGLGRIKRILNGKKPFDGDERYLLFGSEYHSLCLTPKDKRPKWTPFDEQERLAMKYMVPQMRKNKTFQEYMSGSNVYVEQLIRKEMGFGIAHIHGTLDVSKHVSRKRRKGLDLKTTSARTEEEFHKKAIELDYPRQGEYYKELDDLDEFLFLGQSKINMGTKDKPYYPIFHFNHEDYGKEKAQAIEEIEFLLTFFTRYGIPFVKRKELEKRFVRSRLNSQSAWGRTRETSWAI